MVTKNPGDTLTVEVQVDNTGTTKGTETIELVADGTVEDSTTVSLDADGSTTVTLTWSIPSGESVGNKTVEARSGDSSDSIVAEIVDPELTGEAFVLGGTNGDLLSYDVQGEQERADSPVTSVGFPDNTQPAEATFSDDLSLIALSNFGGQVQLRTTSDYTQTANSPVNNGNRSVPKFFRSDSRLAIGGAVYDTSNLTQISGSPFQTGDDSTSTTISGNDERYAFLDVPEFDDPVVRLYETAGYTELGISGSNIYNITNLAAGTADLQLNETGDELIIGADGQLHIFQDDTGDGSSWSEISSSPVSISSSQGVSKMAISPDNNYLAVGTFGGADTEILNLPNYTIAQGSPVTPSSFESVESIRWGPNSDGFLFTTEDPGTGGGYVFIANRFGGWSIESWTGFRIGGPSQAPNDAWATGFVPDGSL